MTLTFDSAQKRTIDEVLEWYQFQVEVLGREKTRVLKELVSVAPPSDPRFFGMNHEEIEDFFISHKNELDFVTMLVLVAAAEAAIRLDFMERVDRRSKDPVSRRFREISNKLSKSNAADRVSLEDDILDTWTAIHDNTKRPISDFKGAIKLRNWLAHGRYWSPRIGRQQYSPNEVYDIANNLLQAINA